MAIALPLRNPVAGSPLSEAEWLHYFQHGYCIIRSLLSPHEVADNKLALENLLEEAKKLAPSKGPNFDGRVAHRGALFVLKNTPESTLEKLYRVCGCGSADPTLLKTSRNPQLLNAFADVLMADSFEQIICQFHAKIPGDNVTFQPHRDVEFRLHCDPNWHDINHWGSYVVAVMAIDRAGPDNGGLQVVPGSHLNVSLQGLKPAKDSFNPDWNKTAIAPELEAGDALLMHPYLVHWSEANTGKQARFSLLSGVCSIGANHENYPGDCTNTILTIK